MKVLFAAFGLFFLTLAANGADDGLGFNVELLYSPLKTFNTPSVSLTLRTSSSESGVSYSAPAVYSSPAINVHNISLADHSWARPKQFSVFNYRMKQLTAELVDVFEHEKDPQSMGKAYQDIENLVNPLMLNYALSVAMSRRLDTKGQSLPPLCRLFADNFVDTATLLKARLDAMDEPSSLQTVFEIPLDKTGLDIDQEHHVAYFREDVGVGVSHWKWHIWYPNLKAASSAGRKNRRGELFYFFHHHILARYDFERLSNGLGRVEPLDNWAEPMEQGYFPKLIFLSSLTPVSSRQSGTRIQSVDRKEDSIKATLEDLGNWRDRILEAISMGFAKKADGGTISLKEGNGIDILGDMIESSDLSPDSNYYGNFHGQGHILIAFSHDPTGIHKEPSGAMYSTITAPRDPTFFRWHQHVENILQSFKDTLPAYSVEELCFPNVKVEHVKLVTKDQPENTLATFFRTGHVDITRGLDVAPTKSIISQFTHLDHKPFTYHMTIDNKNDVAQTGTVRIFLAPKNDKNGKPFSFSELRKLMVEMDRYTMSFNPGQNEIVRDSKDSSVTIPSKCNFHDIDVVDLDKWAKQESSKKCGCGWPHYLLVPRGTEEGFPAILFVMVSDNKGDRVHVGQDNSASRGSVLCGVEREEYPDARAMGYPFDRKARDNIDTLEDFVVGNMAFVDVTIRFNSIRMF